jgi:hypothetical protein
VEVINARQGSENNYVKQQTPGWLFLYITAYVLTAPRTFHIHESRRAQSVGILSRLIQSTHRFLSVNMALRMSIFLLVFSLSFLRCPVPQWGKQPHGSHIDPPAPRVAIPGATSRPNSDQPKRRKLPRVEVSERNFFFSDLCFVLVCDAWPAERSQRARHDLTAVNRGMRCVLLLYKQWKSGLLL